LNESIISSGGVSEEYIKSEISRQKAEIDRRMNLYRKGRGIPDLKGNIIILVDDGVATGATIKAAISTLKVEGIAKLVAALPVAPAETAGELGKIVDEFICLETPYYFMSVGPYYQDFTQVSDEEVVEILEMSRAGKNIRA
jgi:predicted phosphoribosyltransferase